MQKITRPLAIDIALHVYRRRFQASVWRLLGFTSLFILIVVATLGGGLSLAYGNYANQVGSKEELTYGRDGGIILLDRNDKPFFTFYEFRNKEFVPITEVSETTKQALIASEDKDFYSHAGYSVKAISRAIYTDIRTGAARTGGSTITQQLAKIALLTPERSVSRKIKELVIARELEERYSKDEILEMYLNSAYFGEGAFGIEAAAQTYFGKHAKELTAAESAMVVAVLPAPSALSPISGDQKAATGRQERVLDAMHEVGYLSEREYGSAVEQELVYKNTSVFNDLNALAPHFALMVREELIAMYGEQVLAQSGFRVKTTLDSNWQQLAEKIVAEQVKKLEVHRVSNGAIVALDPTTGDIRAMVGSRDWHTDGFGKFNVALAGRQPGSSFKPLVYATALEKRAITAASVLHDQPTTYRIYSQTYSPRNYDGRFRGNVLVRRALANSLNVPAVEVQSRMQVADTVDQAKKFGITTLREPANYGLAIALGAAEVRLLDLTTAYATFANGGRRPNPRSIVEITDKYETTVYTSDVTSESVISAETAYIITSILSDSDARRDVFGRQLTISRTAAVKTGTTSDYKDAWTMGYTPQLAIGVWVGNNDGAPMDHIAGALGAAPIWRQLMEGFLDGQPKPGFDRPAGVAVINVCRGSGQKAIPGSENVYTEYFLLDTIPTGICAPPKPKEEESAAPSPTTTVDSQVPGQDKKND